jgi:hypothetical protein
VEREEAENEARRKAAEAPKARSDTEKHKESGNERSI